MNGLGHSFITKNPFTAVKICLISARLSGSLEKARICRGPWRLPVEECEKLAFERMLDKVMVLPQAERDSLFYRSGYYHLHEQTRHIMGKILTADPLANELDRPPYWWSVRADHFLKLIRPDPNNPADDQWNVTWTRLREEYAYGRI